MTSFPLAAFAPLRETIRFGCVVTALGPLWLMFLPSFLADLLVEKGAPVLGDFVLQLVGPRGVDHRARAVADAIARDERIEWAAPGAPKNFDRLSGIGAAAKHPQEFF